MPLGTGISLFCGSV